MEEVSKIDDQDDKQSEVPDKSTPELVHDNMVQNIVSGLHSAIKANR